MTPTDNDDQPPRLRRPETTDASPEPASDRAGSPWLFDGYEGSDRPVVAISPTVLRGVLLALLVLLLAVALVFTTRRAGRLEARQVAIGVSATPTLPSATPSTSASASPTTPVSSPAGTSAAPFTPVVPPTVDPADLAAWYDASGEPLLTEMASVINAMERDQTAHDTVSLSADCADLGDVSARAMAARPPGFDTQIASDWDDAADLADSSSRDCVQAITDEDSDRLQAALAAAQEAATYGRAVVAEVEDAIN